MSTLVLERYLGRFRTILVAENASNVSLSLSVKHREEEQMRESRKKFDFFLFRHIASQNVLHGWGLAFPPLNNISITHPSTTNQTQLHWSCGNWWCVNEASALPLSQMYVVFCFTDIWVAGLKGSGKNPIFFYGEKKNVGYNELENKIKLLWRQWPKKKGLHILRPKFGLKGILQGLFFCEGVWGGVEGRVREVESILLSLRTNTRCSVSTWKEISHGIQTDLNAFDWKVALLAGWKKKMSWTLQVNLLLLEMTIDIFFFFLLHCVFPKQRMEFLLCHSYPDGTFLLFSYSGRVKSHLRRQLQIPISGDPIWSFFPAMQY